MTVLHFSDTHLGYQAFDQVDAQGVNAREQDVYAAFTHVIDRILALRPDVVVHTGDFFHRPSPSNRALTFGLEQLRRVSDAGIPFVVIAGNHEAPKTIFTSPILRALRTIPNVFPIFEEKYAVFEWDGLAVHGLPHFNDLRKQEEALQQLAPVPGAFNLLMLHTSLGKDFRMDEYGEQAFPPEFYDTLLGFQYLALGHWHQYQPVKLHPNAWYSGSTERFSDAEAGYDKGFILLDTRTGEHRFEATPTRPWHKFSLQRCSEQRTEELVRRLQTFRDASLPENAILTLQLEDITVEQSLDLSNLHLKNLLPQVFQLLVKRRMAGDANTMDKIEAGAFDSLDKLFSNYISEKYKDNEDTAARLREKADAYFHRFS